MLKVELRDNALIIEKYIEKNGINSLTGISDKVNNRFTIIEKDGKVLFDSKKEGKEEEMDSHRYRDEVKIALSGGEGFAVRESFTLNKKLIYYTLPYKNEYIIRVADDYSRIQNQGSNRAFRLFLFFILLNAYTVIAYKQYLKKYYINKINLIKEVIEKGDDKEIYVEDENSIRSFWRVVKDWQDKNIKNIIELEDEKEKLRELISAIDVGIIVLNNNDQILMSNTETRKMFNLRNKSDKYYEKIKYIDIIKFINDSVKKRTKIKEEIFINEMKKYYLAESKYLEDKGFYLIVFKDITKSKEISEIQKRFITNISHELKTPLTNIKGYLIALEEEEEQKIREKFLNIIQSNILKLENIVNDFLNISKIENSKVLNIYPFDISKLMNELNKSLEGVIEKKAAEVKLNLKFEEETEYLNIDFEKVLIILKNLVENAIIYNDKKPIIEILIGEAEDDDYYLFEVKDNGSGIPQSEMDNIFERFYRIDTSRTVNMAGTGLGLSIVKETINNYNGSIKIESEIGKGSNFIFSIPKK